MVADPGKPKRVDRRIDHLAKVRRPKQKGMINKETKVKLELSKKGLAEVLATGVSPMIVMRNRMIDPSSVSDESFAAACALAPYVHPKLNAVAYKDMSEKNDAIDLTQLSAEQLAMLRQIVRTGTTPRAVPGPVVDAVLEDEDGPITPTERSGDC